MNLVQTLKRAAALAAVLTAGTVAVGAPGAIADSGDGLAGCNAYEICLGRDNPANSIQKHFYYDATHGNYNWSGTSQLVQDSASTIMNRDTSGTVYIYNWSNGNQFTEYIPRTTYWLYLQSLNNLNDGHKIV
jgi:hypothetical protein